MKKSLLLLSFVFLFAADIYAIDPPGVMNHQGNIMVGGAKFNGTGYFKFVLKQNSGSLLWSHDGSNNADPFEPGSGIAVPVDSGNYSVELGGTGMVPIPASVFTDNSDVELRVWFSTTPGGTYTQLSPSRRISPGGYAFSAASAESLMNGLLGTDGPADSLSFIGNYFGVVGSSNGLADGIGSLLVGYSSSSHLSFDENEIQSYGGNTPQKLFLNFWGGDIQFGGLNFNTADDVEIFNQVGINKSSPSAMLHIKGLNNSRDNGIRIEQWDTSNRWNISIDDNSDALVFSWNDQWPGGPYAYLNNTQAGLITVSDRSSKRDMKPMDGFLDKVMALKPTAFRYRSAPEDSALNYGFVAQEVEEVLPDVILDHHGLKTMASTSLIAVNTRAIQELGNGVQSDMESLREENQELKERLQFLEEMVSRITAASKE